MGGTDRTVAATVAAARAVGADVIAKGAETPAQQQALAELGVSHGQGQVFGAPVATPGP